MIADRARFQAGLDLPLPSEVAVGRGTVVFIAGWCFCDEPIEEVHLIVGETISPVLAHGMPRPDVARRHVAGDGAGGVHSPLAACSGFWGLARMFGAASGSCLPVKVRATLADGRQLMAALGDIAVTDVSRALEPQRRLGGPGEATRRPLVAICMATYEAPPELFEGQIQSIRDQSHDNWICLISDDRSSPQAMSDLRRIVGGDARFVVSRSPTRLGFYRNFERALGMVPEHASFVALADQDDRWHTDKLEVLLDEIGDARLAFSDARIVDPDGALVSGTYWSQRRPNHDDLLSVLVANSVSGSASLLRRELLDDALPFPPAQFLHYHDHWLALTALCLGEITYIERPLYDYVQHRGATLGHAAANQLPTLSGRLQNLRRDPAAGVRRWQWHYFVDACRLLALAAILESRCADRMTKAKRRQLRRFRSLDRSSTALVGLTARGAREMLGLRHETLGAEWMLAHAFLWRRLAAGSARAPSSPLARISAAPPTELIPRPDHELRGTAAGAVAEKIAPLTLTVRDDGPRRVNLLIPTFDLDHLFGGYIAKFNLARRLAEREWDVRIVSVDPVGPLPSDWREQIEAYEGLDGLFDRVEHAFGRESGLEVSADDRFIATTWWTAHIADAAVRALGGERFLYLIQEYEPFTFPMGSYAALAHGSYALAHDALFSTELLRGYFRAHRIGVYDTDQGDATAMTFQNAITAVETPSPQTLASRRTRRLLFYARPEPHAARNMFELGVLAICRAVAAGAFDAGWELHGIGALGARNQLPVGRGMSLDLLPRSRQSSYGEVLRDHDVGLALMHTPHPSLVPIEMASAGMWTVTNSFENKTAQRLREISTNLITAEPTIEAIAGGLAQAVTQVDDVDARAGGSAVQWSTDWNVSFSDALLARLEQRLR